MPQIEIAHKLLAHSDLFLGFNEQAQEIVCSDWSRLGMAAPNPRDLRAGLHFSEIAPMLLDCIDPAHRERMTETARHAIEDDLPFNAEFMAGLPGAPTRPWRITEVPIGLNASTRWILLECLSEQHVLEEQNSELTFAVEHAMQGISKLDTNGVFIEVRPKYAEMLGYKNPQELVGQSWTATVPACDLHLGEATYAEMLESGRGQGVLRGLRKDGSEFHKQLLLVKRTNKLGEFIGHFCFMRDVSSETSLQRQLEHDAGHDHLTTLINRRQFEQRLALAIESARRTGSQHAVIYLDLDQFKVVNDTLGHVAGDHLLKAIAGELQRLVRSRDTLARLGGDEFAILAEHCVIDDAVRIANLLRNAIGDFETQWEGIPIKVGASIGIATVGGDQHSATETLKRADSACYVAKELGRNRIYVYGETDEEINQRDEQMRWISRIHDALKNDGFSAHLQPIVTSDHKAGPYRHFEALIRLQIDGHDASPGAFLPAAEKYNIAYKLDRWMVEAVFSLMAAQRDWTASLEWISINLSGQTIGHEEFRPLVTDLQRQYDIDPRKVCFEITETAAVTRLESARDLIAALRSQGFRFALDDFGAGVSSFGYLQQLDVDYIKIDGSIVRNIEPDEASAVMVEAIARIATIRGMTCIAEFVETGVVADRLGLFGIKFLQGYHFSRPRPAHEFLPAAAEPESAVDDSLFSSEQRFRPEQPLRRAS